MTKTWLILQNSFMGRLIAWVENLRVQKKKLIWSEETKVKMRMLICQWIHLRLVETLHTTSPGRPIQQLQMIYCTSLNSILLDQPIIQEVIYLILELEQQLQLFKIKSFSLKNMYQMYSSLLMRILRIKRFQLTPHTSKVGA